MRLLLRIAKVFLGFIGAALMLSGTFLVFAGIVSGFGNPALWSRGAWTAGGLAIAAVGFYLFYLACNRNVAKAIGLIFDAKVNPKKASVPSGPSKLPVGKPGPTLAALAALQSPQK